MADGYINRSKKTPRLLFKLQQCDKYIIEELRDLLSPQRPLHKDKNNFRLEISDSILVDNLIDKQVNYNKTNVGEKLPKLNKELMRHFIRGFFDGDGSVSKPKINRPNQVQVNICCSNKNFLEVLKLELIKNDIECILTEEKRESKNMFRLVFSTHRGRIKLFNYMYKNCNPNYLLIRKYNKYTEYVNTVISKDLINL